MSKIELRLWNDQSKEAKDLKKELEEKGYKVINLFKGSYRPAAFANGYVAFGYADIRCDFL